MANESFAAFVKENNVKLAGQPLFDNFEKKESGAVITLAYEVFPSVDLKEYRGITVDEPVHVVADSEIEEEVAKIAKSRATFEPAELIENNEFIATVELVELNKETKEAVEDGKTESVPLYLNDAKVHAELRNSLVNLKKGDSVHYNPRNSEEQAPDVLYNVTVKEIQKVIPAEMTEEFIKEVTGEKFENLEDFKQEIGFQLQALWDKRSREAMENQVVNLLCEQHNDFNLPTAMIEDAIKDMFDDYKFRNRVQKMELTDEIKEAFRPAAERSVRWSLVAGEIIEREKLEIDEEELKSHVLDTLGAASFPTDDAVKDNMLESLTQLPKIRNEFLAKKAMDLILDFAALKEVTFEGHDFSPEEEEHVHDENCDCGHDH
eukprot:TRINITY_DN12053_c0_g1_i1.p1 TRINITY_DN12053_c0_g1~~TRINITY_DN12053_c0_g1_i1.p1  ORF type:complete len:377 (+),score=36.02 TRINITY_DN12053_c0_g1_i1:230-1360(+)